MQVTAPRRSTEDIAGSVGNIDTENVELAAQEMTSYMSLLDTNTPAEENEAGEGQADAGGEPTLEEVEAAEEAAAVCQWMQLLILISQLVKYVMCVYV